MKLDFLQPICELHFLAITCPNSQHFSGEEKKIICFTIRLNFPLFADIRFFQQPIEIRIFFYMINLSLFLISDFFKNIFRCTSRMWNYLRMGGGRYCTALGTFLHFVHYSHNLIFYFKSVPQKKKKTLIWWICLRKKICYKYSQLTFTNG